MPIWPQIFDPSVSPLKARRRAARGGGGLEVPVRTLAAAAARPHGALRCCARVGRRRRRLRGAARGQNGRRERGLRGVPLGIFCWIAT